MATAHTHQQTRILELDPVDSGLSDFFLVTSATNDRQAVAIADEVEMRLKREFGVLPNSVEGRRQGEWVLLDYVDFVVHVFLAERRAFYDIERLRKSARPLSASEFEGELKAALAEKTRSARSKAAGSQSAAGSRSAAGSQSAATSHAPATRRTPAKKAAAKSPAKKSPAKSAARKSAAKPAARKKSPKS
jgi:ribosome-associated protein